MYRLISFTYVHTIKKLQGLLPKYDARPARF